MKKQAIQEVESAAKRFLALTKTIRYGTESYSKDVPMNGGKLTGEIRRASLDLTRRLAEMRKP